jgi:WD40 repeat protein
MPQSRILLVCPLLALALIADGGQGQTVAKDLYGDPLPAGALARLGTLRFRHEAPIAFAVFLPGGKSVLSVGNDGVASVWEFPSGKTVRRFATHTEGKSFPVPADELPPGFSPGFRASVAARAVALAPDGKTLAVSSSVSVAAPVRDAGPLVKGSKKANPSRQQAEIRVYDVATGKERARWELGTGAASEMAFSPDGKNLSVWGTDRFARIWDWANAREVGKAATLGSPGGGAGGLAYSPDGNTLLVSGSSRVLQFVDVATGKEVGPRPGNTDPLTAIWFTPDGKHVLTQAGPVTPRLSTRAIGLALTQPALSTRKWEAATGKELGTVQPPPTPGHPTLLSPDGRFGLAVATFRTPAEAREAKSRPAVLFDTASGKQLGEIGLEAEVTPVHRKPLVFSPDGKMLAVNSGVEGEKIDLYEVPGGKRLHSLVAGPVAQPGLKKSALSLSGNRMLFSADSKVLAFHTGGAASPVVLLDTATGRRVGSLPPTSNRAGTSPLLFSPDGRCLAVDMGDGTVALVELATGQSRRTFGTKRPPQKKDPAGAWGSVSSADFVRCLAISPDTQKLALAGPDNALLLLNTATGKELASFKGHTGPVNAVAFAPDGKTVASASSDSTALIWDLTRFKRPAGSATAPHPGDLDKWWQTLGDRDAAAAFTAIGEFISVPDATVAFLKERVRPAPPLDVKQIREWIGRLDDARYKVREKAVNDLTQIGDSILPLVEQALEAKPSLETRKRLEFLHGQLSSRQLQGERLRAYRAVEVLERIGTTEARQILQELAAGNPGALVTLSAQAALKR